MVGEGLRSLTQSVPFVIPSEVEESQRLWRTHQTGERFMGSLCQPEIIASDCLYGMPKAQDSVTRQSFLTGSGPFSGLQNDNCSFWYGFDGPLSGKILELFR